MAKIPSNGKLPPVEQLRGRPVGRILIKMGILSREKVHECLKIQKENGDNSKLGEILISRGWVDQHQLQIALAAQRGMEYTSIAGASIPADVIAKVPAQLATGSHIVPIEFNQAANELTVVLDTDLQYADPNEDATSHEEVTQDFINMIKTCAFHHEFF